MGDPCAGHVKQNDDEDLVCIKDSFDESVTFGTDPPIGSNSKRKIRLIPKAGNRGALSRASQCLK